MENEQTTDEKQESDGGEERSRGSKSADNPEIGEGTGEGTAGLGAQTGAVGGGHPVEPEQAEGGRTPPDQLHPHGQSGR